MPKRYFCEYCWKSFQDTLLNRQKHLKGGAHQRNKRQYYEAVIGEIYTDEGHGLKTHVHLYV